MTGLAGAVLAGAPLAAEQTSQAGPVGLFLILGLLIATVFLIRSMNGRLRRLPPSFDPPAEATDSPPASPGPDGGDRPA